MTCSQTEKENQNTKRSINEKTPTTELKRDKETQRLSKRKEFFFRWMMEKCVHHRNENYKYCYCFESRIESKKILISSQFDVRFIFYVWSKNNRKNSSIFPSATIFYCADCATAYGHCSMESNCECNIFAAFQYLWYFIQQENVHKNEHFRCRYQPHRFHLSIVGR